MLVLVSFYQIFAPVGVLVWWLCVSIVVQFCVLFLVFGDGFLHLSVCLSSVDVS